LNDIGRAERGDLIALSSGRAAQGDRPRLAGAARERHVCEVHAGGRGPVRLISRIFRGLDYLGRMLKSAFDPCIPTRATAVPDRPEWIHAIKHDGYRLIVQREGNRVRLWTRNGHDWSDRFPLITEAALRNRNSSFVIDGEAVLLGVDGLSDFDGLHSRKHDDEVQFYAFDCLVSDGEDLRRLPLSMRKTNLARLLARRIDGIFLSDFETGEIGPDLFRHACLMGLEGLVSKHRESTYRSGQFRHWVKVKNRAHPAFARVMDQPITSSKAGGLIGNRQRRF
jgi:ATP-dependent DNA ligase